MKNKPKSQQHRDKISKTKLERYKLGLYDASYNTKGIPRTEETKRKLSKSQKQRFLTNPGTATGRKHYTNGIINRMCYECPEGFWLGRTNVQTTQKGFKWYTNGIIDKQGKECPDGFRPGRTKVYKKGN